MKISKLYKIEPYDLDIYNPEKLDNNSYSFNIKYMKKKLVTQTPKLLIDSLPIMFNNSRYYKICFKCQDIAFNNKTRLFVNSLLKIEKHINNLIPNLIKKTSTNNINYSFISNINVDKTKSEAHITLNIQNDNSIPVVSIFDFDNKEQPFNSLKLKANTINLVMLNNIWVKNNKIGLNWILLQTKIYEPFIKIDKCLIIDEEEEILDTSSTVTDTASFFTPITSPNIKNSPKKIVKIHNCPPPPPPPPPPSTHLKQLSPNVKLNIKEAVKKETKGSSSKSEPSLSSFIPSAEQLQNAIKNLKKRTCDKDT